MPLESAVTASVVNGKSGVDRQCARTMATSERCGVGIYAARAFSSCGEARRPLAGSVCMPTAVPTAVPTAPETSLFWDASSLSRAQLALCHPEGDRWRTACSPKPVNVQRGIRPCSTRAGALPAEGA